MIWIASAILIAHNVVYGLLGGLNIFILFGPSVLRLALFIFIFYRNKQSDYESYKNPLNITCIQFGIFVIMTFNKQTKSIGCGITINKNNSIQKEIVDNSVNKEKKWKKMKKVWLFQVEIYLKTINKKWVI